MSRFLLLLGPSGAGKSTIIEDLERLDDRFTYISARTTRPLRTGETHKVHVTEAEMAEMEARGEFVVVNSLYGARYGTPRRPILEALARGRFPVLDWPVQKIGLMRAAFPGRLYVAYVSPPSISALRRRLASDGRDRDGSRLREAEKELRAYWGGEFADILDLEVVNEEDTTPGTVAAALARLIYINYLDSFMSQTAP